MRLTTPSAAAGAVLLAVAVTACTGGGSSIPKVFTPSVQPTGTVSQGTRTPSPSGGGTASSGGSVTPRASGTPRHSAAPKATGTATAPASPKASGSHSPVPAHHASHPASVPPSPAQFPGTAPETGGGGTAGLQDGLLFGAGGGAVLVGLGTLAYRRRLARKFAQTPGSSDQAEREPVDH